MFFSFSDLRVVSESMFSLHVDFITLIMAKGLAKGQMTTLPYWRRYLLYCKWQSFDKKIKIDQAEINLN